MRIEARGSFDFNRDFQFVDSGDGHLLWYALGRKTGDLPLGEVAIRKIATEIEHMSDDLALDHIERCYHTAVRLRAGRKSQSPPAKA